MCSTIPAEFLPLLTESLLEGLRYAAEAIVSAGLDPNSYAEPLAELDAVRGALDAIGWGAAESIDVHAHRDVLRKALTVRYQRPRLQTRLSEPPCERRNRTMLTTIAVPADVAAQLRRALYADLARAGNNLDSACSTKKLGDVASPVGKLRRLFAVLDDIGWVKEPPSPEALTIHRRHLRVVVDTLENDQEGWEWAADQPQLEESSGRERAKTTAEMIGRFLATLPTEAMSLAIQPSVIPQVCEGASALVRDVAQAIDNGEDLRDSARQLQAIAALQDALGEDADAMLMLDVAEHGDALRRAVEVMVSLLAGWLGEMDAADPRRPEREDEMRLMRQLAAQVSSATGGGE